ncbi:TetR/AcrR family transcriptional regulator [Kribbella sp. NPDC049584]|uniref:TetR/AcrR family transcriptional regulator n=1 Tax=Kribbella sp. NPDC049584 TaxID=3154833 RepID=UPI00343235B8
MSDAETTGPRLTSKGRATRDRILGVAADLILEHGVAGTGIEDVRKAAGVSGSQMTHYFTDKRSLVKAVVCAQADSTIENHRHPDLGALDTFEALELWAEMQVGVMLERECVGGCVFGSLAGQLVETDADFRADLASGFDRWLGMFRDGLAAMKERGDLREDADPEKLACSLLGAQQGGMLLAQTFRDPAPLRASLSAALAHLHTFASDPAVAARTNFRL